MTRLKGKRIMVTGGANLPGGPVIRKLEERGCRNIFVPLAEDHDLVEMEAEAKRNVELEGGPDYIFSILDADRRLTPRGLRRRPWTKARLRQEFIRAEVLHPRRGPAVRFIRRVQRLLEPRAGRR